MPENQDTKNTTDQGRSGGYQTQESDREGQGPTAETRDEAKHDAQRGGYGQQAGGQSAAAAKKEPFEGETSNIDPQAQYSEEDAKYDQGNRSDSKESLQDWSPSSEHPDV